MSRIIGSTPISRRLLLWPVAGLAALLAVWIVLLLFRKIAAPIRGLWLEADLEFVLETHVSSFRAWSTLTGPQTLLQDWCRWSPAGWCSLTMGDAPRVWNGVVSPEVQRPAVVPSSA